MKIGSSHFQRVCNWVKDTEGIQFSKIDSSLPACFFETDTVHIKIVDYLDSENEEFSSFSGKFMMETKETFHSWNDTYYKADLPVTKQDFNQIMSDMLVIQQEEHIDRADNFYQFFS